MKKRFELIFTFLQLPLDFLMLALAGFSAYRLRFAEFIIAIRPILFDLPWPKYWPVVLAAALGWIIIFILLGLYRLNPHRKLSTDLSRIVMACSTGFAAITMYVFFALQKFDSRFLVLVGWFLAIIYVSIGRIFLRGLKGWLYRLGIGLKRVVIIGSIHSADRFQHTFAAEPRLGYAVVGRYDRFTRETQNEILNARPDELLLTNPKADESAALAAIDFAGHHHLALKYSADLFATITSHVSVTTIAGLPIVELQRTRLLGWGRLLKRLLDLTGSLVLLIITAPLLALIALAITLGTGRPVIYQNERVGQHGKKFLAFKFRTMFQRYCTGPQFGPDNAAALKTEAELIARQSKPGPVYKIKDDPRVTPLGRILRRWSLDELPQLWNVLKGEMSLVGPRPHQPREVAQYEPRHSILFAIRPGLTGLAQISGRSNLTFDEEARLDTFYIEHWNWWLDSIILLKTPLVVLSRRGSW